MEAEQDAAPIRAPEVVAVVQHDHQSVTVFDGMNVISFTMAFTNFAKQQGIWEIINGTRLRPHNNEMAQAQ